MNDTQTKKKVLIMVTSSLYGGVQKYIGDLVANLDKDEFEVAVAVGGEKKDENWINSLGKIKSKIYRLKHVVRELNPWHDFLSAFEIYELLANYNPDIVHLNSSKIGSTGACVTWLFKKFHRKKMKIIYTAHGFVFNEPLNFFLKKFYIISEKISGFCKNKIICVSERDKIEALNRHIAHHKKFITIHNGIDLGKLNFLNKKDARQSLIKDTKQQNEYVWIGTIANLFESKGIKHLIKAAKIVKKSHQKIIFVVIGEGPLKKMLEKQIVDLDLENYFYLVGAKKEADQYLKAFDIFVLPSVKEGFPYSVLEAMSAGLPLVTTSVGGVVEIVENEENGLVVVPEKPHDLAKNILRLVEEGDLRHYMSKNNLEKIKSFSLQKMIRETEKVYNA